MTGRWRPTRAGLIGLWRYWDETFAFHNGRLLLRGPNGSGKSMALELLLPFLLDGDSSPAKLTSSGRNRGRLFDRLMTGSADSSRTGYAWIEFTRGAGEVFTVGARIRGSQSTQRTDVDLFTSTLSVGRELHLLDQTRTPLSRSALVEAIGDSGRVHASAEDHRSAVRQVLFPGFSADRYTSVIGALLALRREKLSERLDPEKLSSVLSEALPPLDDHDLTTVAEGFERLDRRRDALAELERDVDEVRQLARRQRAYAETVVVARAAVVRSAETARDEVTRRERAAREQLTEAEQRHTDVCAEHEALTTRTQTIDTDLETLKASDAYRDGVGLADLRQHAAQQRQRADADATRAAEQARQRDEAAVAQEEAQGELDVAHSNVESAEREVLEAADAAAGEQVVGEARTADDPEAAESLLHAWLRSRRQRVSDVRRALAAHGKAVVQRDVQDQTVADAEHTLAERQEAVAQAKRAEDLQRTRFDHELRDWAGQCSTVGSDRLAAVLPSPAHDPAAVTAAIGELRRELDIADATAREQLEQRRAKRLQDVAQLRAERRRWEGSSLVDPEPPAWRSAREGRPGAALWRLVDVRPGVPDDVIDGVEAALTAIGLLDAWVAPDGHVDLPSDLADVQLTARATDRRNLGEVLTPAAGSPVPSATVAAVLASIAVVDSAAGAKDTPDVAIGRDGTFRVGSAHGRGPRRSATMLGAVARERHRLQRLAEIDGLIAELEVQLASLDREQARLDQRRDAIAAELADVPTGADLLAAGRAVDAASARRDQAREALDRSRGVRALAEESVRTALRQLTTLAAQHGLPADVDALDQVEDALRHFESSVGTWTRRRREVATATRVLRASQDAAARAADNAAEAEATARSTEQDAAETEQKVHTLEASVGADYDGILRRIDELDRERRSVRPRLRELDAVRQKVATELGALSGQLATAEAQRAEADTAREGAQRGFTTVLRALGPDAGVMIDAPLDSATAVLARAREIAAQHEKLDVSDRLLEQRSNAVADALHRARAALGTRIDLDRELADEGWWVLRTTAAGLRRRVGELGTALAAQLAEGRAELKVEEERLFEQTLAGSVRRALADRIRQARALVDGINAQLGAVRTAAAGVAVQLRWEVDPDQPAAVREARGLLLRDPADLSDAQRAALQDFVRARVEQARVDLAADAPWSARLRESLDYRAWHHFTLQVAHRDWDGFQQATPTRLQKLSTGERSIALHLPMIASLAAHYADESGQPAGCPRLILLDELFAGVDAANRAQLFGAFTTWQLDAVFTSDHEWCQYADLDGIAIHYLHPPTNDDPVTSTRFTWDGSRRVIEAAVA